MSIWTASATSAGQRLCILCRNVVCLWHFISVHACRLTSWFHTWLRSWMFVVLVMGLFHWILLCLPDTRLMTSMFPMYLLGAVVVWMTLIWMMIPSILVQTLVLMMILMETMVIPTLCQQMDTVSKYIFRAFTTQVRYRHDPPRMLESNPSTPLSILIILFGPQDKYHPTYMGWTHQHWRKNNEEHGAKLSDHFFWRTTPQDSHVAAAASKTIKMFERLKENPFGITWAEWRTKLQQKVRGHRQQRQLDTVVAARVRQI